jgi:integrase
MGKARSSNRVNFTVGRIEKHKCEEGKDQSFIWDTSSPCLGLRTTRNGSKSFFFQAPLFGEDVRKTIGSAKVWTIPQARAKATEWKVLIDQGIDPRKVVAEAEAKTKAEATEKAARKMLAREAWNTYLAARRPMWSDVHYQDHLTLSQEGGETPKIGKKLTKPGPLASLLALPLFEITATVVADWIRKESSSRATSTRNSFRKFKAFILWCAKQDIYKHGVQANCCIDDSVKEIVPPNRTKEGDSLQKEQLALWFEQVRKISNPYFSAYFRALLLTGARRSEMLLLKWKDLNFEWKTMRLYDTEENTGERTIPLTPYLGSVLAALPRLNDYVFASPTSKEGHVIGVTKPHTQAIKNANLPHVTIHGLRRSFGTLSEWLEIPVGVVAQIEGRKPSAIAEKHYKRRPIDMLRMHHVRIEAWILEQAGIKFVEKNLNEPATN